MQRYVNLVLLTEVGKLAIGKIHGIGSGKGDNVPPFGRVAVDVYSAELDSAGQACKTVRDDLAAGRIDHPAIRQEVNFSAFLNVKRTGNAITPRYFIESIGRGIICITRIECSRR